MVLRNECSDLAEHCWHWLRLYKFYSIELGLLYKYNCSVKILTKCEANIQRCQVELLIIPYKIHFERNSHFEQHNTLKCPALWSLLQTETVMFSIYYSSLVFFSPDHSFPLPPLPQSSLRRVKPPRDISQIQHNMLL